MNWLDDELRSLFRRKEPPEGFAEQVLARVEATPPGSNFNRRRGALFRRLWVGCIAGAAACLLVAIGLVQHQHQQCVRTEAALASQQATMALDIASAQINMALQQAQQVTGRALAVKSRRSMGRL